jgi:hypothetical protein
VFSCIAKTYEGHMLGATIYWTPESPDEFPEAGAFGLFAI